jgi:hypothetical protein
LVKGTAAQHERYCTAEEILIMPALLWVVFWSSMMASAACFGELPKTTTRNKEASTGD